MSSLLILTLLACGGGPPSEVPDKTNQITAEVVPDLVTIGSVDLPWLMWLTVLQLGTEEWRDCPRVTVRDDGGITVAANDCVDSTGVQWFGTATLTVDAQNDRQVVSLQDFGANDSVGGWTAKGQVAVETTANGFLTDTDVVVTSLANDESFVLWADVEAAYATYDDVVYADRADGRIGVEGWGTAELTARTVPVSLLYGCGVASPYAGRMTFESKNESVVTFGEGNAPAAPPPPADTGDTGGSEDTGPEDTAAEDTSAEDTGTDSVPPVSDGENECEVCREASIDETALGTCLDLTRTLSWPFPSPF